MLNNKKRKIKLNFEEKLENNLPENYIGCCAIYDLNKESSFSIEQIIVLPNVLEASRFLEFAFSEEGGYHNLSISPATRRDVTHPNFESWLTE